MTGGAGGSAWGVTGGRGEGAPCVTGGKELEEESPRAGSATPATESQETGHDTPKERQRGGEGSDGGEMAANLDYF